MNRNPSRPPQGIPNVQQGYPHPSLPPQALRPGPQRQNSRPMRDPQPQLQRQRSGPNPQYPEQRPVLQRQPSRPDQQYQERQPRSDPYYPQEPQRALQSQPMPDVYQYNELPMQPVAPAFVRSPSTPPHPPFPHTDSQTTLLSPPSRPYAKNVLLRSNSDDTLDSSDVFWRRFNANAVQQQLPDAEKSSWLEKNAGKSSRYNRSLWIAGLFLVLLAAGGIGIGVFLSFRNSSNESRPDTIGGAADITSAGGTATAVAKGTLGVGGVATTSSLHVTPTNTVP